MTFPENVSDRNKYILQKIENGEFTHYWAEIKSIIPNHEAIFYVSNDALKIDGIRVNVSASLQQQIADLMHASLLTPKLTDLIHEQADVKLEPIPRQITDSTAAMIDNSKKIDAQIIKKYPNIDINDTEQHLISTVGKDWVLINKLKPTIAANYGWHFPGQSFQGMKGEACAYSKKYRVIQGVGTAHNPQHVDYSQICRLVLGACTVDGQDMMLTEVLTDPSLANLASHEGVLNILKQPY